MSRPRRVVVELTRPGKGTWHFEEVLALDDPDLKVLYTEHAPTDAATDDGEPMLQEGSPMVWFIFPGKWFEVGSFYDSAGALRGWYTNFCTPFEIIGDRWRTTDLFLDLWQPKKGETRFLDEDELQDAVRNGWLEGEQLTAVQDTRKTIETALQELRWPPTPVRELDLNSVRSLL